MLLQLTASDLGCFIIQISYTHHPCLLFILEEVKFSHFFDVSACLTNFFFPKLVVDGLLSQDIELVEVLGYEVLDIIGVDWYMAVV